MSAPPVRHALVIGASRGLGLALARQLVRRRWCVTATTRQDGGELGASADASGGTVAVMSSDQGSVSLNTEGGYELYKASKAALNQLVRSHVTRRSDDGVTTLLLDPGHDQTRLRGFDAPLTPSQSIPAVVDVLDDQTGAPGLQLLDRHGEVIPW